MYISEYTTLGMITMWIALLLPFVTRVNEHKTLVHHLQLVRCSRFGRTGLSWGPESLELVA